MRIQSFLVATFVITFALFSFPFSTASGKPRWEAFRKIIPFDSNRDPLLRLQQAYDRAEPGRTELEQVLKTHRATSLTAALQELDGRLDGYRKILLDSERQLTAGEASLAEYQEARQDYSDQRLTVQELVDLILFYREVQPKDTQLIRGNGIRRDDAVTARLAINVTKFPYTEVREHGQDAPPVPFDESMRNAWIETIRTFIDHDLRFEFVQIWTQMVNQNSGHARFRHIESFEERLIWEIRRIGLYVDEFRGQDLLLAYLSNYQSNQTIDSLPESPTDWDEEQTKRLKGTVAEFLVKFSRIKDRARLAKFFQDGTLPKSIATEWKSKQINRVLRVFQAANSAPQVNACMRLLNTAAKYKTANQAK